MKPFFFRSKRNFQELLLEKADLFYQFRYGFYIYGFLDCFGAILFRFLPEVYLHVFISRVLPDTDLAGYQANNFAGYRISGLIGNMEFF